MKKHHATIDQNNFAAITIENDPDTQEIVLTQDGQEMRLTKDEAEAAIGLFVVQSTFVTPAVAGPTRKP